MKKARISSVKCAKYNAITNAMINPCPVETVCHQNHAIVQFMKLFPPLCNSSPEDSRKSRRLVALTAEAAGELNVLL